MTVSAMATAMSGGGRPPMCPKPIEVGKEYDKVTELSRRGDGVAKVQGFVIFVQGARVGQKVKIRVDRDLRAHLL